MSKEQLTGACRFCGQHHIIETDKKLTMPQVEEEATRLCQCEQALDYIDKATKKDRAIKRVEELCGEEAGGGQTAGRNHTSG